MRALAPVFLLLYQQMAARKIQTNISMANWIRDYPLQSAGLLFVGGFVAGQLFFSKVRSDS